MLLDSDIMGNVEEPEYNIKSKNIFPLMQIDNRDSSRKSYCFFTNDKSCKKRENKYS